MPTENRSSNTEMVSVQATIEALEEAYAGDGALEFMDDAAQLLRQFQAKPAQHQGEPVALPARMSDLDRFKNPLKDRWNACLDEIAKLGPLYTRPAQGEPVAYVDSSCLRNLRVSGFDSFSALLHSKQADMLSQQRVALYTHADPGEVERLKSIERSYGLREALLEQVKGERDRMIARTMELAGQLAERDALLRDIAKAQDEEGWWVSSENGPDYWECPACYATSIAVRKNGQIVGGGKGEIKHEWDCWIQRCAALSGSAETEVKS